MRPAYPTTGAGHPAPVVELAAELRDQIRRVLGVRRLDEMVIVGLLEFAGHGDENEGRVRGSGFSENRTLHGADPGDEEINSIKIQGN